MTMLTFYSATQQRHGPRSFVPLMYTLRAHPAHITALDFLDQGRQLCSSDQEGWTIWWSLETRRPLCIWKSHKMTIISTKCRGNLVYTHGRDNLLRVWRLESSPFFSTTPPSLSSDGSTYPAPWMVHQQDINALNFCSIAIDENEFATPSTLSSDKIDVYTLEPFSRPIKGLAPEIYESDMASEPTKLGIVMAIRLYDDYIVIGYESGHVAIYERSEDPQIVFIKQLHKDPLQSFTRVGKFIYTAASDRLINRIDVSSNFALEQTSVPKKGLPTISHLDQVIFTAGWDGYVRMFDLNLESLGDFRDLRQVSCLAVSIVASAEKRRLKPLPTAFLAVAGKDARISLHEINDGEVNGLVQRSIMQ